VHYADSMRRAKPLRGLKTDVHCLGLGHGAAGGEHVGEQLAGEKLGHRVDQPLRGPAHLQETGHMGVPYLACPSKLQPVLLVH
jgi:hypothetical protein